MVDMSRIGTSDLSPRDVAIIREVYDNDTSEDMFSMELERALQVGCRTIIIEPTALAKQTTRWIAIGSAVKKLSFASGIGTFIIGLSFHDRPFLPFPFGLTSSFCYLLYKLSWREDPCSRYRVETKLTGNASNTSGDASGSAPAVLVKKESQKSDLFYSTVAVCALGYALRRVFPAKH